MLVVFSDLDGTLLDHETYDFSAARPALDLLARRGIPLVLASSKTEAEMRPLAASIGIDHPMIVENGAGVANLGAASEETNHYDSLRALVEGLPQPLRGLFSGFGDWSAEQVSERTGLSLDAARLAKQRRFSEPGLFSGTDAQREAFLQAIEDAGYKAAQGGRFLTLMPQTSKAERMREVVAYLSKGRDGPVRTVALGDAPNDLDMLQAADIGVIIANPAHAPLPVTRAEREGAILRSDLPGPSGWNQSILDLVDAGF